MTRFLAASIVALVAASPAAAGSIEMDHNGSAMTATVRGHDLSIAYLRPRPGLLKAGFEPGMLLVDATIGKGGAIAGSARAFSSKCGWSAYPVKGTLHTDAGIIELRAPNGGPSWDKGCSVRMSMESPHTELIFEAAPAVLASIDPDAAEARSAAEMATIFGKPAAPAAADVKAPPAWDMRPATPAPEPQQAALPETPAPVVETVERDETPPPAPVAAAVEQTEDQAEEAQAETAFYTSPEFQAEIAQEETSAEAKLPPPTPLPPQAAAEATPPPPAPPAKKKIATDF